MNLSNTYEKLGEEFRQVIDPIKVRSPELLLWNSALADSLMIPKELQDDPKALAQLFSGNERLPDSTPVAIAYAGHQFGNFVPQLGDGRAHLIGEVIDDAGQRMDVHLKGSGRTRFSRGGDGRCAVGPAVREFIMSEAMHALGIPTTRSLAVVTTGEDVFRRGPLPGAVVTRVASSHLRVGTFEYFAARGNTQALRTLCDYAIKRHYPEIEEQGPERYLILLDKVIERQILLVVDWMRVGFIHGVMNTDNTSISGETIDYGPCAMMNTYAPETVFSSIDTFGRYAFGNQPKIAQWNMARFAETLLPILISDEGVEKEKAIEEVSQLIVDFTSRFEERWDQMMAGKLGLLSLEQEDPQLFTDLLTELKDSHLDYTVTFHRLTNSLTSEDGQAQIKEELGEWYPLWKDRLERQDAPKEKVQAWMRENNPVVIPRNYLVEEVLQRCEEEQDSSSVDAFLKVLRSPYQELPETSQYQAPPPDNDRGYRTFCGT